MMLSSLRKYLSRNVQHDLLNLQLKHERYHFLAIYTIRNISPLVENFLYYSIWCIKLCLKLTQINCSFKRTYYFFILQNLPQHLEHILVHLTTHPSLETLSKRDVVVKMVPLSSFCSIKIPELCLSNTPPTYAMC